MKKIEFPEIFGNCKKIERSIIKDLIKSMSIFSSLKLIKKKIFPNFSSRLIENIDISEPFSPNQKFPQKKEKPLRITDMINLLCNSEHDGEDLILSRYKHSPSQTIFPNSCGYRPPCYFPMIENGNNRDK